jgi:glutamyl-Q tRNA(Asp) synthetase
VTQPVFRFAPSPNGRLHLGHAYSALLNEDFARRLGGRLLLRIEDIDRARCRPELETALHADLSWLGLAFEEPARRQSDHFGDYQAAAARLSARGLLYPCFCSRRQIADAVAAKEVQTGRPWPRDPDGVPLYPGICRGRGLVRGASGSGGPALRLDMAKALCAAPGPHAFLAIDRHDHGAPALARPERWGDAVIVRKETPTSYHLSVVADDALQGVTHVVRGADLEGATDLHVLLQALLDLPTPRYHHHALIRNPQGDKLSKSLGSRSLAEWRAEGASPAELRRRLGFGEPARPVGA